MTKAIACLAASGGLLLLSAATALGQDAAATSHAMYLELQRQADAFVGKPLSFAGKVIETVGISSSQTQSYALRVNVTPGKYNIWEDTIYVEYKADALASKERIADGVLVSVRGTFTGIKSYQSVVGDTIKVPAVTACAIRPGREDIAACPGETAPAGR
jgi:hypothetical protein